ncbi:MAG: hypothetical protein JXA22_03280 [Candidatus Thermoplasmatota archaeon]|nr:hypothetical protein [Candidatus Thermoplasmatota archaeon]
MSGTEGRDPFPGYGGEHMPPLLAIGVSLMVLSVGIGIVAFGSRGGGYDNVEKLASVKCLGCLGLDPVVPGFNGFWTYYPEGHTREGEIVDHPEWMEEALARDDVELIILFYWTPGCVPCAQQWDEMRRAGLVSGEEEGGREGDRYQGVLVYSLDASEFDEVDLMLFDDDVKVVPNDLFWIYHFNGDPYYNGVPDTVFLFEMDGQVHWFMHYGRMDASDVDGMITNVLYNEIAHA